MKKNNSSHYSNNEDTELGAKKLVSALDKLDDFYPVVTPDIEWFQQVIMVEKKRLRRKFVRELTLFLVVAFSLLSAYFVVIHQFPIFVLVVIQIVLTVLPIIVLITKGRRIANGTDAH